MGPQDHWLPTVLGWRASCTVSAKLRELWQHVDGLGWLPDKPAHVVIQVGPRYRSTVVLDTAWSLASFLEGRAGLVEVLDLAGNGNGRWDPGLDVSAENVLKLAGTAARGPVVVPRFWFSPHFLVTVTGIGPSSTARISAVLDAQASVLRRLGNAEQAAVVSYEAHNLAASDLAIACGRLETPEFWWAISSSDVAVEQAVAKAAGIDPDMLPGLRALASHELLDPSPELLGGLPSLRGYAAPGWYAVMHQFLSTIVATARGVGHDVRMFHRAVRKIPALVRRLT